MLVWANGGDSMTWITLKAYGNVPEIILNGSDVLGETQVPFWFMLKADPKPHVRFRVPNTTSTERIAKLSGVVRIIVQQYELEEVAFGGPNATETVLQHFVCDAQISVDMWRNEFKEQERLIRSLRLWRATLELIGLDYFESWDVWGRVCALRKSSDLSVKAMAEKYSKAVRVAAWDSFDFGGNDFVQTLQDLSGLYQLDKLTRGLRSILATIIIFHWNRINISEAAQAFAAECMVMAYELEN